MATVTRIFEFDAAHRVMNEKVKCFNLHGHRFKVEVTFSYKTRGALGYAIDFKEIKRIVGEWIDEHLDHACLLNPFDMELINMCRKNKWRFHIMGMGHVDDINPSAENIASELTYIIRTLFINEELTVENIRIYETPNCWVDSKGEFFYTATTSFIKDVEEWRKNKGEFNYDIRKD